MATTKQTKQQNKQNKRKKPTRKQLVKKLDTIVSLIVRKRDKKCVICGSTERLTNGHLFSRIAYSTRWDLQNCNTQCWSCNFRHEFDPYLYQEWYKNTFGSVSYHELHRRFAQARKFSDIELGALLLEMEIILGNLP